MAGDAIMTAPGTPFEMIDTIIDGQKQKAWKYVCAPANEADSRTPRRSASTSPPSSRSGRTA